MRKAINLEKTEITDSKQVNDFFIIEEFGTLSEWIAQMDFAEVSLSFSRQSCSRYLPSH